MLMALDALALAAAYFFAVVVRYDGLSPVPWRHAALVVVAAVALQWAIGLVGRLYRGRVGVATNEETLLLGTATAAAGLVVFIANALTDPLWIARSLPLTATFFGFFLMLTTRALWRRLTMRLAPLTAAAGQRTLVVGAGASGARLVHSMRSHPESGLVPVGFLDDDPWMRKRRHFGVPVLGTVADLERVVLVTGATTVVVAIPSASKELIRTVVDRCTDLGITAKVLPSFAETFASKADVRDVRDVDMRDLLGRAAIQTDLASIAGYVTGKRVLVTGAGGSIGSELCRQLHRFGPAELIMLDRDESALHGVQLSIHGRALLDSPDVVLNDIRDEVALRRVFEDRRPEVVFHAAALKHLPMLEQYPHEAMKTNVLGTANVLEAAAAVGVTTFVNISTDKAADPTSVLGYSKRAAERLTADMARRAEGAYLSVRFGNVLGSRGSVLHTFTAQIEAGGPVTVVHPEVTRYFMTVEEAVQLVIQAGAIGEDGEVMILDMGQPVKIVDMAQQLIAMSGKSVEIVYTGLRDGEKLHEELFGAAESDERSKHPLVSHAHVEPLSVDVVRSFDLGAHHLGLLQAFEDWVHGSESELVGAHGYGRAHGEAS
ncbi:polysaccharide biosynthesis protein [Nocardioides ganghwensis]|uniref:Polysaccharide biosynthesis protein n=2 Tax=Nocardioides ganghwensis TaxID=252230 RepID=A0A4Q2SDE1_9ACTN|nr:polysaccharide biosynthesis protein [Nocardioides ganghwensis]RYC00785.1 polysaccharide biosynthesis protein [Nocardioides ganghwensis]